MRNELLVSTALCVALWGCGDGSAAGGGDGSAGAEGSGASPGSGGTGSSGGAASGGSSTGGGGGAPIDPQVPPEGFWDRSNIPAATQVLTFRFLNRSNGTLADDEMFWKVEIGGVKEIHSFAEKASYDMPANASGRMYFYVCRHTDSDCQGDPEKSKYYDFIEHTIGDNQYNGNTTRVDAFGLKIAMLLHAADGYEKTVGEDYATFAAPREKIFQDFLDFAPDEFDACASDPFAPYRIVEPGAVGFNEGGAHADYYASWIDQIWANNGITNVPKAGPNGSGLAAHPDLSAAIFRHVGANAGTFDADGNLLDQGLWADPATFYSAAPANYYAAFWHAHAIDGRAYGFPYDDVGSYSTYVSHADPEYLLIAVGF